jgi:hypothetical protein
MRFGVSVWVGVMDQVYPLAVWWSTTLLWNLCHCVQFFTTTSRQVLYYLRSVLFDVSGNNFGLKVVTFLCQERETSNTPQNPLSQNLVCPNLHCCSKKKYFGHLQIDRFNKTRSGICKGRATCWFFNLTFEPTKILNFWIFFRDTIATSAAPADSSTSACSPPEAHRYTTCVQLLQGATTSRQTPSPCHSARCEKSLLPTLHVAIASYCTDSLSYCALL